MSSVHTTGAVTTAIIAIVVADLVAPAVYPLVVHAAGVRVSEVTQTFTLTIEARLSISLSAAALSIVQGASTTTTVTVVRNNVTDPVELYVDIGDEESTLPPGVTAVFAPNPTAGDTSVLTLTVGAEAAPGFYNLYVHGYTLGAGWGAFTPLALTVHAAP